MNNTSEDIFERLKAGEVVLFKDPQYPRIFETVSKTIKLAAIMNASADINHIREKLSDINGEKVDESTTVLVPFHTNFGRFVKLGKMYLLTMPAPFLIWAALPLKIM